MAIKSKCCTCGFEWITGQDGSHLCSAVLQKRIDKGAAILQMMINEIPKTMGEPKLELIFSDLKDALKELNAEI